MEKDKDNQHRPKNLLEEYGRYDPKLDLSEYQYPTLDLLPESIKPVMAQVVQKHKDYRLPLWLSAGDTPVLRELYHHPNVLLAGTIASGKTQFVYNHLMCWLYTRHPSEIKFVICRSKPVDYNSMAKIERHFLGKSPDWSTPVAEYHQVLSAINGLNIECDLRLDLFQKAGVKNIADYNEQFVTRQLNPEEGHRFIPDIVLILDDLSTFLNKETTEALIQLTQQNLYTGIYVVAVTSQIASRDISPQLRANFSIRIAMRLMSQNESRRILDRVGAEKLSQAGELLYEEGEKLRKGVQPLITYQEILSIADFIGHQRGYPSAWLLPEYIDIDESSVSGFDLSDRDPMFEDAARLVVMHQQGSTSLIQRKLKLGYNRVGRIVDQLEAAGIVGPFEGSKAREVLFPDEYSLEQFLDGLNNGGRVSNSYHKPDNATENTILKEASQLKKSIKSGVKTKAMPSSPTQPIVSDSPITAPGSKKTKHHNGWITTWIVIILLAAIIYFIGGWKVLLGWLAS